MNFGQWLEQEFHQNPWRFVFTFGPLVLIAIAFIKFLGAIGCRWSYPYYVDEAILANWWHLHHVLAIVLMAAAVAVILAIDGVLTLLRRRKTQVSRSMERMNKLSQAHNRLQAMLPDHTISTKFSRQLEEERAKMAAKLHAKPKKAPETPVAPVEEPVHLPETVEFVPPTERSIMDSIDLGLYKDGTPASFTLTAKAGEQRNMLIAGASGFGKTATISLLMANFVYCRDVWLAGIDTGGTGLKRWRKAFRPGWFASDPDDVAKVMGRVLDEIKKRRDARGEEDEDIWTPSPDTPEIILIVDEGADMAAIDGAEDLIFDFARRCRQYGGHLIFATQTPRADVIPKRMQSQLQIRLSLWQASTTDSDVVFGLGSSGAGWDAHSNVPEAPGWSLLSAPGVESKKIAIRNRFITTDQVKAVIADVTGGKRTVQDEEYAEWREVGEKPAPVAALPPKVRSEEEQKAWCREESRRLLREGLSDHHRPPRCEKCGKAGLALTMHHFDYFNPYLFAWYCWPDHMDADHERKVAEGKEWSAAQVMEAINLVHLKGWKWNQVEEHYGYDSKNRVVYNRCRRAMPGHEVFRKRARQSAATGS